MYAGINTDELPKLYSNVFKLISEGQTVFSNAISSEVQQSVDQLIKATKVKKELEIEAYANWIMAQVQQLVPGQSYTMQGGWSSANSGHSMLYRFKRISERTFNLYIYEGNAGSLHDMESQMHKTRISPCFIFEGVTFEELFFLMQKIKAIPFFLET
ncbi:MAG: hypothetical protein HWD61_06215 [Parachlamydiaceae bacterium]|nr:MAG: hypothetical protein HWD61_06215 [Parachlamydiaceae bacterium]